MAIKTAAWEEQQLLKEVEDLLLVGPEKERYLDMGLEVRVLDKDKDGTYTFPGQDEDSNYKVISVHRFGGRLDKLKGMFIGPPKKWLVKHAYPKQWEAIAQKETSATLMCGGEGSGKTQTACLFTLIQILIHRRCDIGFTAPTQTRVNTFTRFLLEGVPEEWYHRRTKAGEIIWATGVLLQCVSTTRRSNQGGSPLQGFTWSAWSGDEIQDYETSILEDAYSRGRGAKGGWYRRLCTATPRDDYTWRNTQEKLEELKDWSIMTLIGPNNVFVSDKHWELLRASFSHREYQRRVLALNLPPERAIYDSFSRETNLRTLPNPPPNSFNRERTNYDYIVGFDPGTIKNVSVLVEALNIAPTGPVTKGETLRPDTWWVRSELVTHRTTVEEHALAMVTWLRKQGVYNGGKTALVLFDPASTKDSRTSEEVRTVLARAGLNAQPAIYGEHIHKESRIAMLNGLFCSESGRHSLIIERVGEKILCPYLVESLESALRDEHGDAEKGRKSKDDFSHSTSALAYALYRFEKVTSGGKPRWR